MTVRSDIALPGFRELTSTVADELLVTETPAEQFRSAIAGAERPYAQAGYERVELAVGAYIRWQQDLEYLVQGNGRRILWHRINSELNEAALRSFTFGHVLSHALTLQGFETLHGTAALIAGGAVAFLGNCGYGKSTLASWLLRSGLPLMTDDILVVRHAGDRPIAYPGLPQIKLLTEAAAPLFTREQGSPMCTGATKLIFALAPEQYHSQAAPLHAIYVLTAPESASEEVVIQPVHGTASFLRLIENIFIDAIIDAARQRRLFALLDRLCSEIPVRSLSYPRRQEIMPEVVARVRQDAQEQRR